MGNSILWFVGVFGEPGETVSPRSARRYLPFFLGPKPAMRKLLEIANAVEAAQDGLIHIEKITGPFLFEQGGKPAEYVAGLKPAIERGLLLETRVPALM